MADKSYENIRIEREGAVTFVILNRPDKRNAMSPALHYDMEDALGWLATDKQTRALVLTGAGEAWSAGQDLKLYFRETSNNPEERRRSNSASHHWRWEMLNTFPKTTIAMVNGYCFGGAFTQLCACDFAIAEGLARVEHAEIGNSYPSASSLVQLAHPRAMREEFEQPEAIHPLYLRRPDAEINWSTRNG